MTNSKPLKAWQRLTIEADLNYPHMADDLERANKRFLDTTGMIDGNGKRIKRPRISKGRKTSLKISVNSGLAEIAGILATSTGKSRNKVMSILVSQCLYDTLRDLKLEQQRRAREQICSLRFEPDDEIPF